MHGRTLVTPRWRSPRRPAGNPRSALFLLQHWVGPSKRTKPGPGHPHCHAHLRDLLPEPAVSMVLLPRVAMLPAAALVVPRMVLLRASVLWATAARAGRRAATAAPQPARKVIVAEARPRLLLRRRNLMLDGCAAPAYSRCLRARQTWGASGAGRLRNPEGCEAATHVVTPVLNRKTGAGGPKQTRARVGTSPSRSSLAGSPFRERRHPPETETPSSSLGGAPARCKHGPEPPESRPGRAASRCYRSRCQRPSCRC